jgi:hypothetical protein
MFCAIAPILRRMLPIRRILVAIKDPGANALPTVAKAARLARACDAHPAHYA